MASFWPQGTHEGVDLSFLCNLKNLRFLFLNLHLDDETTFDVSTFDSFSSSPTCHLPHLESLRIENSGTEKLLALFEKVHICDFSKLVQLHLHPSRNSPNTFVDSFLTSFKKDFSKWMLKTLHLNFMTIGIDIMNNIGSLPQLEVVTFRNCDFAPPHNSNTRSMMIPFNKCFDHWKGPARTLRVFMSTNCTGLQSLEFLRSCNKLEKLVFQGDSDYFLVTHDFQNLREVKEGLLNFILSGWFDGSSQLEKLRVVAVYLIWIALTLLLGLPVFQLLDDNPIVLSVVAGVVSFIFIFCYYAPESVMIFIRLKIIGQLPSSVRLAMKFLVVHFVTFFILMCLIVFLFTIVESIRTLLVVIGSSLFDFIWDMVVTNNNNKNQSVSDL
jgi:hypothetical protein